MCCYLLCMLSGVRWLVKKGAVGQMVQCAVSPQMVEEVRAQESAAKANLEAKRARLAKLGADRQLQELAASLRQSSASISSLRQVCLPFPTFPRPQARAACAVAGSVAGAGGDGGGGPLSMRSSAAAPAVSNLSGISM